MAALQDLPRPLDLAVLAPLALSLRPRQRWQPVRQQLRRPLHHRLLPARTTHGSAMAMSWSSASALPGPPALHALLVPAARAVPARTAPENIHSL